MFHLRSRWIMKSSVIPFPTRPTPPAPKPVRTVPIVGYINEKGEVIYTRPRPTR